jgi:hypothetical protein
VSATHIVPACASHRALSLSSSILAQDLSEPFRTLEIFRRGLKAVRGRLGAEGTAVLSRETSVLGANALSANRVGSRSGAESRRSVGHPRVNGLIDLPNPGMIEEAALVL